MMPLQRIMWGPFSNFVVDGRQTARSVPVAYLQTVRKKEIMTRLTRLTLSSFVFCSLFFFSSLFFLVLSF